MELKWLFIGIAITSGIFFIATYSHLQEDKAKWKSVKVETMQDCIDSEENETKRASRQAILDKFKMEAIR